MDKPLCRTCGSNMGIHEIFKEDETNVSIKNLLGIIDIDIKKRPSISSLICAQCLQCLKVVHSFKVMCDEMQRRELETQEKLNLLTHTKTRSSARSATKPSITVPVTQETISEDVSSVVKVEPCDEEVGIVQSDPENNLKDDPVLQNIENEDCNLRNKNVPLRSVSCTGTEWEKWEKKLQEQISDQNESNTSDYTNSPSCKSNGSPTTGSPSINKTTNVTNSNILSGSSTNASPSVPSPTNKRHAVTVLSETNTNPANKIVILSYETISPNSTYALNISDGRKNVISSDNSPASSNDMILKQCVTGQVVSTPGGKVFKIPKKVFLSRYEPGPADTSVKKFNTSNESVDLVSSGSAQDGHSVGSPRKKVILSLYDVRHNKTATTSTQTSAVSVNRMDKVIIQTPKKVILSRYDDDKPNKPVDSGTSGSGIQKLFRGVTTVSGNVLNNRKKVIISRYYSDSVSDFKSLNKTSASSVQSPSQEKENTLKEDVDSEPTARMRMTLDPRSSAAVTLIELSKTLDFRTSAADSPKLLKESLALRTTRDDEPKQPPNTTLDSGSTADVLKRSSNKILDSDSTADTLKKSPKKTLTGSTVDDAPKQPPNKTLDSGSTTADDPKRTPNRAMDSGSTTVDALKRSTVDDALKWLPNKTLDSGSTTADDPKRPPNKALNSGSTTVDVLKRPPNKTLRSGSKADVKKRLLNKTLEFGSTSADELKLSQNKTLDSADALKRTLNKTLDSGSTTDLLKQSSKKTLDSGSTTDVLKQPSKKTLDYVPTTAHTLKKSTIQKLDSASPTDSDLKRSPNDTLTPGATADAIESRKTSDPKLTAPNASKRSPNKILESGTAAHAPIKSSKTLNSKVTTADAPKLSKKTFDFYSDTGLACSKRYSSSLSKTDFKRNLAKAFEINILNRSSRHAKYGNRNINVEPIRKTFNSRTAPVAAAANNIHKQSSKNLTKIHSDKKIVTTSNRAVVLPMTNNSDVETENKAVDSGSIAVATAVAKVAYDVKLLTTPKKDILLPISVTITENKTVDTGSTASSQTANDVPKRSSKRKVKIDDDAGKFTKSPRKEILLPITNKSNIKSDITNLDSGSTTSAVINEIPKRGGKGKAKMYSHEKVHIKSKKEMPSNILNVNNENTSCGSQSTAVSNDLPKRRCESRAKREMPLRITKISKVKVEKKIIDSRSKKRRIRKKADEVSNDILVQEENRNILNSGSTTCDISINEEVVKNFLENSMVQKLPTSRRKFILPSYDVKTSYIKEGAKDSVIPATPVFLVIKPKRNAIKRATHVTLKKNEKNYPSEVNKKVLEDVKPHIFCSDREIPDTILKPDPIIPELVYGNDAASANVCPTSESKIHISEFARIEMFGKQQSSKSKITKSSRLRMRRKYGRSQWPGHIVGDEIVVENETKATEVTKVKSPMRTTLRSSDNFQPKIGRNKKTATKVKSSRNERKQNIFVPKRELVVKLEHNPLEINDPNSDISVWHRNNFVYVCKPCELTFHTQMEFNYHYLFKCTNKQFKCHLCTKSYSNRATLVDHLRTHTHISPHKCEQCGKVFLSSSKLSRHITSAHSLKRPCKCTLCKKRFVDKGDLKRHLMIHSGERPFKCMYCDKAFVSSSNLRSHRTVHLSNEDRPHKCTLCTKAFGHNSHLKVHMQRHNESRPHKCLQCGKDFRLEFDIKRHMITHSGIKPFKCKDCPKRFLLKVQLQVHEVVHTGQKPYVCEICTKPFAFATNLTRHLLFHSGARDHKCTMCEKDFILKAHLKNHILKHHATTEELKTENA